MALKIIGYSSDDVAEEAKPKRRRIKRGKCCYCEINLNSDNYSKEHVIPKHKGGTIIKPCCKECNFEKGGMMLSSYIKILNKQLLILKRKYVHSQYLKLTVKIKNAKLIQIELQKLKLKKKWKQNLKAK